MQDPITTVGKGGTDPAGNFQALKVAGAARVLRGALVLGRALVPVGELGKHGGRVSMTI